MKKTNIYIINIGNATATSGVDRYLEVLLKSLRAQKEYRIYKIELIRDASRFFHSREEKENYTAITIPFPVDFNEIIKEKYWMQKYNRPVFDLIQEVFDQEAWSVIHIHTLNLINLALYIKSQIVACSIITHLHCIPWKNLFNKDCKKFNFLYSASSLPNQKVLLDRELFLANLCELDSYLESDRVVTVTTCAKEFLVLVMEVNPDKISVVPNGLFDSNPAPRPIKPDKPAQEVFNCLFVGVLTESKGILFILESLRIVQAKGYKVNLHVAGAYTPWMQKTIQNKFNDLSVNLLGRIPFSELKKYYASCDIGLIASLQEQCSYVAIEMAMFGLPIVTTAVDGLDEMFTDGVNALKVQPVFSKIFGLKVDTERYAEKIIELITDGDLRRKLSASVRQLYEERYTSERMIEETLNIYKEMTYE